jgi:hypothetical protein
MLAGFTDTRRDMRLRHFLPEFFRASLRRRDIRMRATGAERITMDGTRHARGYARARSPHDLSPSLVGLEPQRRERVPARCQVRAITHDAQRLRRRAQVSSATTLPRAEQRCGSVPTTRCFDAQAARRSLGVSHDDRREESRRDAPRLKRSRKSG